MNDKSFFVISISYLSLSFTPSFSFQNSIYKHTTISLDHLDSIYQSLCVLLMLVGQSRRVLTFSLYSSLEQKIKLIHRITVQIKERERKRKR